MPVPGEAIQVYGAGELTESLTCDDIESIEAQPDISKLISKMAKPTTIENI